MSTNNCKNFKKRTKNYKAFFYCSHPEIKGEITFENCKGCKKRDTKIAKQLKSYSKLKSNSELKKRTAKQAKAERDRFSLFTDDLTKCIEEGCGKTGINKHEIFGGRNRQNSIKYGLVIPLCTCKHHDQVNKCGIHFDTELRNKWHKLGQAMFMEHYSKTADEFKEIFGRKYL